MKHVLCLTDNKEWSLNEFTLLESEEVETRRHDLVCVACGGKAFLRRSVRTAGVTFGARHAQGCKLLVPSWSAFRYLQ